MSLDLLFLCFTYHNEVLLFSSTMGIPRHHIGEGNQATETNTANTATNTDTTTTPAATTTETTDKELRTLRTDNGQRT